MQNQEPENLSLSLEDIDETIQAGTDTHNALMEQIGNMISEASVIANKIGRYQELRLYKLAEVENKDAVKH